MSIKTIEGFHDKLDKELSRRKMELSQIRELVYSCNSDAGPAVNARIRGAITLLYAHWEGAVKSMAEHYIRHVSAQKLPYKALIINFLSIALREKTMRVGQSKKISEHIRYHQDAINLLDKTAILKPHVIRTDSNLKSHTLKEIVSFLGISFSVEVNEEKIIDEDLLGNRNSIAHGCIFSKKEMKKEEYIDLHDTMICLIDRFAQELKNAALNKSYLKNNIITIP